MNDRPTAAELVAAVRQDLEGELIPARTDARLCFQTLYLAITLDPPTSLSSPVVYSLTIPATGRLLRVMLIDIRLAILGDWQGRSFAAAHGRTHLGWSLWVKPHGCRIR